MSNKKKFKSNVQSKAFYKEAEDMQDGWGRYLKSIDMLKDRVELHQNIRLNEACWILYGEGYCSFVWENFKKYCIKMKWNRKSMPWEAWKGLFDAMPEIK